MINEYVERFEKAKKWTNENTESQYNYNLDINTNNEIDMNLIVSALVRDFSGFIESTSILPGRCFQIVREVSYVLFSLKIKHTVTIGDIKLKDRFYVGLNDDSLKKEIKDGYKIEYNAQGIPVGVPADAHAWITLENGQIIDATILSSLNAKAGNPPLEFKDAFYFFDEENKSDIIHIPYMTGFAYHYLVLTDPRDSFYQTYMQWYETFFGFVQHMESV